MTQTPAPTGPSRRHRRRSHHATASPGEVPTRRASINCTCWSLAAQLVRPGRTTSKWTVLGAGQRPIALAGLPTYSNGVLVRISPEAAAFISANGGELWVWAIRPRMCCAGAPALMHAATAEPDRVTGFTAATAEPDCLASLTTAGGHDSGHDSGQAAALAGLRVHFRPMAGQRPDVLEIGLTGRRRPRVAAYWDGCLMAMV